MRALTDSSNLIAWSIFLGNPSIKNRPLPSCHARESGDEASKDGGELRMSRIAFSSSWT